MSIVKKFTKVKEDFVCENCGQEVKGDGFTNHCPKCFYSKHVDIFPGDRLEECHGMLKPVDIEFAKGGRYIILHKCEKCGEISKDKFREKTDDFDKFMELVEVINKKKERRL